MRFILTIFSVVFSTLGLANCNDFSGTWSGTLKNESIGSASPISQPVISRNQVNNSDILVNLTLNNSKEIFFYGDCRYDSGNGYTLIEIATEPHTELSGYLIKNKVLLTGSGPSSNIELMLIKNK